MAWGEMDCLAGTKGRAAQEPEERANAYQRADGIEDASLDDSLMQLAKDIIKQAGIPGAKCEPMESDTVGSKIMMKHPDPIINAKGITVKTWARGYSPGRLSRQRRWLQQLEVVLR